MHNHFEETNELTAYIKRNGFILTLHNHQLANIWLLHLITYVIPIFTIECFIFEEKKIIFKLSEFRKI